ncbi:MAG: hypothetical protein KKA67_00760 [Spirochaetes bacterium]|nr:hypothetical protein [Spirochaetota bacterium]MBU1082308.1 hypothetical protein [Spirochaetota bacterium]
MGESSEDGWNATGSGRKSLLWRLHMNFGPADFATRLKARFLMILGASMLAFTVLVLGYSAIIQRSDPAGGFSVNPPVLVAELAALLSTAAALALLGSGRFAAGAHLLLSTALASVWLVMFLGRASGAVVRLDSIAFVIAILCISPLAVSSRKWPILLYAAANIAALWVFMLLEAPGMGLAPADFWDYLADNTLAISLVGILGFSIHGITAKALDRAATDIEKRKRAETALSELNAQLEHKVAARTEELSMTNLELQAANGALQRALGDLKEAQDRALVSEKLATLGRISASVAHELNTPLAAIDASNRSMKAFLERGLDEIGLIAARLDSESLGLLRLARRNLGDDRSGATAVDPPGEREARRKASAALSAAGVAEPDMKAEDLIECGLGASIAAAIPVLKKPGADDFMLVLRATVGAIRAAYITEDAVEKAARVVGALRNYGAGSSGDEPRRVDVAGAVRAVLALFQGALGRGATLSVEAGAGLVAFTRENDFERTLFNVVSNAVQAVQSEEKGGEVTIATRREGELIAVSVVDTGRGIQEGSRHRIFEAFYTTKAYGEGMGLGLSVARRLARENGGDILFDSEPGRTEFRILVPSAPREPDPGEP